VTDDDLLIKLVRDGVGAGYHLDAGPVWLMVRPQTGPLPEHGWKLHISTRAKDLPDLVRIVLPVLVAAGSTFKLARSSRVLAKLSDGMSSPASVGKAVTIYPDQRRVAELGRELAALLAGWPGPRVLSDRRVERSSPVYYRYGPFASRWESDPLGRLTSTVHGPGGEVFEAAATLAYRQPTWATDPFAGDASRESSLGIDDIGTWYQVTAGLRQAAQGNVYRAVDRRDDRPVVIKQARALVAEDSTGADTRMRLRNERRVLQAIDAVEGVPRFLDHFRHGDDEFLVTSDCGLDNLVDDLVRHGLYSLSPGPRSLGRLAVALARILSALHSRGVIIRDLKPANVVIGELGPSVVDFGVASYGGIHLSGATAGYAPARQYREEPPAQTDDYHALGMVLLFAATGTPPVVPGEDADRSRVAALQMIASMYGDEPAGIICSIAELLSGDEPTIRAAFMRILTGSHGQRRRPATPLPTINAFGPDLAADIASGLLGDLLQGASALLNSPPSQKAAHNACIYDGSAGIGLELLRHLSEPGVVEVVSDIAAFSLAAAERVRLPPGLFSGTTGVSIFLRQAAASGIAVRIPSWELPGRGWSPEKTDLITGAAGIGIGHIWLHQATGDPAHLAIAMRCAETAMADATAGPSADTSPVAIAGVDMTIGRAHGLAGPLELLLALADLTGDVAVLAAAADRAKQLADKVIRLLPAAGNAAAPIAMSWCQGLAGVGQVLLHASRTLTDESLAELARKAADLCIAFTHRLGSLTRCCGAAGVGHFLIDMAAFDGSDRYWQAAMDVGRQISLRGADRMGKPSRPADAPDSSDYCWSSGIAGNLSFFRRLARQNGLDSIPLSAECRAADSEPGNPPLTAALD
jgi:serine/threonine protein kinase